MAIQHQQLTSQKGNTNLLLNNGDGDTLNVQELKKNVAKSSEHSPRKLAICSQKKQAIQ
jgi:hypothetical protein